MTFSSEVQSSFGLGLLRRKLNWSAPPSFGDMRLGLGPKEGYG